MHAITEQELNNDRIKTSSKQY